MASNKPSVAGKDFTFIPAGEVGTSRAAIVRERGEYTGVRYQGQFYTHTAFNELLAAQSRALSRRSTVENSTAKRNDELKALALTPYEKLDTEQKYAAAGETVPIAFCLRENNSGGLWISPSLLDSASVDFTQYFLYLISHGSVDLTGLSARNYYFGKYNYGDTTFVSAPVFAGYPYTDDSTVCPLVGVGVTCDHSTMSFLTDPLSSGIGALTKIQTVDKYVTGFSLRIKPVFEGGGPPTGLIFKRYLLKIYATNNSTGSTSLLGNITTNANGVSINFAYSLGTASNYTITVENNSIADASGIVPDSILLELTQTSAYPGGLDRTSSYVNLQMLVFSGNLFNLFENSTAPGPIKQLHIFLEEGIEVMRWRINAVGGVVTGTTGPSNKFADLVLYWFENSGKFTGLDQINYFNFSESTVCTLFHSQYNINYNAYLTSTANFLSYAQTTAPFLLCSLIGVSGIFSLKPLLPVSVDGTINPSPLTPEEAYTDSDLNEDSIIGSIITGSYVKTYKDREDRLPITVVVTWRDQSPYNVENLRTTSVRYSDYAIDSPEETYDLAEFCTNAQHAELFAKYVLATRRYSLHTVKFQTARNAVNLDPLDLISVSMTRTNSEGDSRVETEHYLVDSLEYDPTGVVTITASQFPLDGSSISIINSSILTGSFVVTT